MLKSTSKHFPNKSAFGFFSILYHLIKKKFRDKDLVLILFSSQIIFQNATMQLNNTDFLGAGKQEKLTDNKILLSLLEPFLQSQLTPR